MGKEVEMNDVDERTKKVEDSKPIAAATAQRPAPPVQDVLGANVKLIEKAVRQKEVISLFSKILRQTQGLRKRMTSLEIQKFVRSVLPDTLPTHSIILDHLKEVQSVAVDGATESGTRLPSTEPLPEIEIYAMILALTNLVDSKQWKLARSLAEAAIERLSAFNRRTLDAFAARIYFYYSWAAEKSGALADIRSVLLGLHRSAVLRHDDPGQEMLLNLLLRNYLHYSLYDQAEALRAKAQPDAYRSSAQHSRLLYYQGRIRAVHLEYSDAKDSLTQSSRKAPASASGFRIHVIKWLTVVRLLLGEVPSRAELSSPDLHGALAPYLDLAQAVRSGDLTQFASVAAHYSKAFSADGVAHLVSRLRSNVIRAGLRRISSAYSRISVADVAAKLGLPSTEDAEFIIAKAIRDGGIAATLDHEAGTMIAARAVDVYVTDEPQVAFHARIAFCMDIHNEVQKAMRYDPRPHQEWDDANALRERQEQELLAALDDDEMEF